MFSHPEIVKLLQTEFIPYAGDQWYLHRQQDEAGKYFWQVAQQGHNKELPKDVTRQGVYAATADGKFLGSLNHPGSPERNLEMMRTALQRFRKSEPQAVRINADSTQDVRYVRTPPKEGLVLNVFSRIPLPLKSGEAWSPNQATGRDHLWLTAEEKRSLVPTSWQNGLRYSVPPAIAERIARFHLLDNIRGEPDYWERDHIRQSEMTITVVDTAKGILRWEGFARMQRAKAQGVDLRLQGTLRFDSKTNQFTRFDILSWGEAWGEGTYTGGAPQGRFPLLIALSLAGNRAVDRIPPQASRTVSEYFITSSP